jgi:acetyl esterase/lipase
LFHGSDDHLISPVQTAALHHALRAAGADSTRYLVVGAGHGDIAVKGGEEKYWTTVPMLRIMTDFLDHTLAASSPPREHPTPAR